MTRKNPELYWTAATIAALCRASGSGPDPARMLARRWSTLDVAGIAHVTASCESTNLISSSGHDWQSSSRAHSGSGWPDSRFSSFPSANGRLASTAMPRSCATGSTASAACVSAAE